MVVPLSWAAALALLAGCTSPLEAEADLAFQMGRYTRAHDLYAGLLDEHPGNEDLARKEQVSRLAAWFALGREAVFQDRLALAAAYFRKVLAEIPDHGGGRAWLAKVQSKQADLLVHEAQGQVSRQAFDQARRLAGQALALWPGHEDALHLLAELDGRRARERQLGRFLLAEGLKVNQEMVESANLPVVRHYLKGARVLLGEEFTHDWVLAEVERRMGEQALAQVRESLGRDENASALVEASLTGSLLPEVPGLDELKALAQRELEADALAEQARQLILRGDPEGGRAKMAQAAETSRNRAGLFKAAQVEVEEARLAREFEEALDREAQGRYEEALARYQAIAAQHPFFRDSEARARELAANLEEAGRILGEVRTLMAQGSTAPAQRRLKDLFVLFPWHKEGLMLQRRLQEGATGAGAAPAEPTSQASPVKS